MNYRILYSETAREQICSMHPSIKPDIRTGVETIKQNPYNGKKLQRELSGYFSYRVRRFRIIYKINTEEKSLEIHYIGHRKNIYEIIRDQAG